MRLIKLLLLVPVIFLAGCVISVNTDDDYDGNDWKSRQHSNERIIKDLELGQAQDAIERKLGTPDFVESFSRNGDNYRVLYYRTHRTRNDGRTTKDETTPLVFIDGELVGWGESAIDHATR